MPNMTDPEPAASSQPVEMAGATCICDQKFTMTEDNHAVNCPAHSRYWWWLEMQATAIQSGEQVGSAWRPISEITEEWRYDFQHPIICWWDTRSACETYWDEDEEWSDRPKWWISPRCGWRSPGDQCIPANQDAVTHWMPMPSDPAHRTATQSGKGLREALPDASNSECSVCRGEGYAHLGECDEKFALSAETGER